MKVEAHTKFFQVPCSRIKSQGGSHLHGLLAIVTTAGGRRGGLWLVFDGRKSRDKTEQQFEEEQEPASTKPVQGLIRLGYGV